MRRKHFSKMLVFFIAAIMLLANVATNAKVVKAAGTESAATFQNGKLVLTPEDGSGKNPDLFQEYTKNLVPGDKSDFIVKLNNNSSERVKFYFWASDTDFGKDKVAKAVSDNLLSKIELKITVPDSKTTLYEGPANGNGTVGSNRITRTGNSDGIDLGWLSAGTSTYLQVSVAVPTGLGNEYQAALASVDWTFLCEVYEVPPTIPTVTPEKPTATPQVTPTATPQVTPTATPTKVPDEVIIKDDKIPEGSVDVTEKEVPVGVIIVNDKNLGKLPQTGTFASVLGNSSSLRISIFITFALFLISLYIKIRRHSN